jgi:hypothetical protein
MKRFIGWASAAVVAVAGLVGCNGESGGGGGGGGGGGITGRWTIDADKTMGPIVDQIWNSIPQQAKDHIKNMKPEELAAMPAAQREQMEMMTSKEKMKEKMAKEAGDSWFDVKSDGTYVGHSARAGQTDDSTGTWSESGGTYTFTSKTENGKPAEGEKAKPHTGQMEGGELVLVMKNDDAPKAPGMPDMSEMKLYLKRK